MIWWIGGTAVLVLLVVVAVRAVSGDDRRTVSWWAARNGFRYTGGTARMFDHLRGAPFDRGTSQDPHDVLSGTIAGRPGLIMQFSWFRLPTGGGPSGLRSGICSVAVLELPAPVPELSVREETTTDRARGRDLQLESEQFNEAFRISGAHDRFTYDVLNPRVMAWLLGRPRYRFRLGGRTLAVWRDGALPGVAALGELRDFAAELFGMIPSFVYTAGYPAEDSPPLGAIPAADLGKAPIGTLHVLQHLTHRGHEIERYEHQRKLWGTTETAISVKIAVPTVWPVLMIAAKSLASDRGRQPKFDDGVLSGQELFDEAYACGTPRPDFALSVLHKEFTDLLVARRPDGPVCVILQSEHQADGEDWIMRGGLWVTAAGELADQALADRITELACDLMAVLPPQALQYHLGAPVTPPPDGRWGNELPGYFVLPSDRV